MSGRRRNLVPTEKIVFPLNRPLPEVICESPGNSFGAEVSSNISEAVNFKTRFRYNSTTSSAQSQRFQDMFYKTDWPSLSDTGTDSPDFMELEGSDSSASSMFSWADSEGTKMVAEEWEKIQRTLYNEPGPKVTQKHLIDECNQWTTTFPHLRIVGRSCGGPNYSEYDDPYDTEEEVLALQYDSDVELNKVLNAPSLTNNNKFQDVNSQKLIPLKSIHKTPKEMCPRISPNTSRSKSSTKSLIEDIDMFLHITPMVKNFPTYNYRDRSSAIIKSEITSSKWRRGNMSPDFVSLPHTNINGISVQTRDNSAESLFSLVGARKHVYCNSHTFSNDPARKSSYKRQVCERRGKQNNSDKHSQLEPLEPIASRTIQNRSLSIPHGGDAIKSASHKNRIVSLPPIQSDENSRKKQVLDSNTFSGKSSRKNKTTLTPINFISSNIQNHNVGDFDTHSSLNGHVSSKKLSTRKKSSKKKS